MQYMGSKWNTCLVGYTIHTCPSASIFVFISLVFLFHQHPRWYHISIDSVTVGDRFSVLCDRKGNCSCNWGLHGARFCLLFMCWDFITMGNVVFLISVLAACCQQPPAHTLAQPIILWFLINHHSPARLWFSQSEHSVMMGQRCDDASCSTT